MKTILISTLLLCLLGSCFATAQDRTSEGSWQVSVNTMEDGLRGKISNVAREIQSQGGPERSVIASVFAAAGISLVSNAVEIVSSEVVRLTTYRKEQQKEWLKMIEKECSYSDEISSVKGLNDFYGGNSSYGALDPSGINFDGISVRGMREGKEVLYLSCHIDTTRLEHLFRHSKFYLVLDTLCFYPYECHLPNLSANGIHSRIQMADTERDNTFSYDEREGLTVGMEFVLKSSWINEAILVQDNVELGRFNMEVKIPQNTVVFVYSRKNTPESERIQINGDCFIVPRSFMPLSGGERMWGTGEYNISIKFTEKCRFNLDKAKNAKLKNWHKDYVQLRKMQNKGSEVEEYFETVWKQYGNTIIKTTVKQSLTTATSGVGRTSATSGFGKK